MTPADSYRRLPEPLKTLTRVGRSDRRQVDGIARFSQLSIGVQTADEILAV